MVAPGLCAPYSTMVALGLWAPYSTIVALGLCAPYSTKFAAVAVDPARPVIPMKATTAPLAKPAATNLLMAFMSGSFPISAVISCHLTAGVQALSR